MAISKRVKSPPKRKTAPSPPAATAATMTTTLALVADSNIGPYFSSYEAARINGAIVNTWKPIYDSEDSNDCDAEIPHEVAERSVQDIIESCMAKFFEKRRESGDSRPCGRMIWHRFTKRFLVSLGMSSWRKAS
ncbi:uncharacterized protein DNG_04167 [Cephalotrichum gorgonifer]|uniref:Uncharacterized protein n=1 Tax=Cephalotrichum gorgonifer TaxID=2041049 RepID=A0AAE8MY75_9PEZI|nr:uncharacterized protein DNG_04167 [Cephalotrichum gorgonifer]